MYQFLMGDHQGPQGLIPTIKQILKRCHRSTFGGTREGRVVQHPSLNYVNVKVAYMARNNGNEVYQHQLHLAYHQEAGT